MASLNHKRVSKGLGGLWLVVSHSRRVAPAALDRTQPKSPPATYVAPAVRQGRSVAASSHGPTSFSPGSTPKLGFLDLGRWTCPALANTVLTAVSSSLIGGSPAAKPQVPLNAGAVQAVLRRAGLECAGPAFARHAECGDLVYDAKGAERETVGCEQGRAGIETDLRLAHHKRIMNERASCVASGTMNKAFWLIACAQKEVLREVSFTVVPNLDLNHCRFLINQ